MKTQKMVFDSLFNTVQSKSEDVHEYLLIKALKIHIMLTFEEIFL